MTRISFKEYLKTIEPSDLPGDLGYIAEHAGVKVAIIIMELFSNGVTLSIPKSALKKIKDKYILQNCNGSRNELLYYAKQTGYTDRYVAALMKRIDEPNTTQTNLFDNENNEN